MVTTLTQSRTIDDLYTQCPKGTLVEVVLFKGAEWYNGYTPAPTTNMQGYDPSEEMTKDIGNKVAGFVQEYKYLDDEESARVVLSPMVSWQERDYHASPDFFYVSGAAVHSFRKAS